MKLFFRYFFLAAIATALLPQRTEAQVANNNPTGPAGDYNGIVTTAGSYDPFTGSASREICDISVAGAVGAYPLKWTRRMNTRAITRPDTFGHGGGWSHSYEWELAINHPTPIPSPEPSPHDERPDGTLKYPDGRSVDLDSPWDQAIIPAAEESPYGMMDRFKGGQVNGNYFYDLLMADGGVVKFSKVNPGAGFPRCDATEIVDPYGLITTLVYEGGRLKRIKEPGGEHARYLEITYGPHNWEITPGVVVSIDLIDKVEAYDGFNHVTQSVSYAYTEIPFDGKNFLYLTSATYIGGDTAEYDYQASNRLPPPNPTPPFEGSFAGVIWKCRDDRFAGPMKRIMYELRPRNSFYGAAYGEIWQEKNAMGYVLSELEIPQPPIPGHPYARREHRGNASRTFYYDNSVWLSDRSDFSDPPNWSNFTVEFISTSKNICHFQDENLHTTSKTREGDFQATTLVTYPDPQHSYIETQYEDPLRPHYVKYRWDEKRNKTTFDRNADHSVESILYPNGTATGNDYPEFPDSPSEPRDSFTYSDNGFRQIQTHTLPNTGTEHFEYDNRGLKQLFWPPATGSDPYPDAHKTKYFYYTAGNSSDRPDRIDRLWYVEDPRGYQTFYDYNERGQVTRVTHHEDNSFSESYYDHDGTMRWTKDELGHITNFEYDEYKRVTHVKKTVGGVPEDTVTYYAPPGTTINPLWHTTSSIYRVTSPEGKVVDYDYDANFRRTMMKQAPGTPDVATTNYHYDPAGNLDYVDDPRGFRTLYEYDERNRQTTVTNVALNETTTVKYDPASNKIREERPDGTRRSWDYDSMNRLHHAYDWRITEEPTAEQTTTYGRDSGGMVRYISDTKGAFYRYVYDSLNRKITATYPTDATGFHRDESWHYDFAGNMDQYTNPAGQVKHLHYDPRNRLDHSWWTGNGVLGPDIAIVPDEASRIQSITTNNGETIIAFGYDEANRQKWEEQTLALPGATPSSHRVNTILDHDGLRQTLELTDPPSLGGNLSMSPEMSGSGSLSISYHYTWRNQLDHIGGGPGENWSFTYKYDPSGNMSWRRADYNGQTNWTKCPGAEPDAYDALNRPKMWEQIGPNGFYTLSHHQYDHANREESTWRDEDQNGDRFAYEPTNQLAGVAYNASDVSTWPPSGAEQTVTYDYALGKLNRSVVTETLAGQTPTTQSYAADPLNQYMVVGGNGYSYDNNFNLTHAGAFSGVYNAANQLVSASNSGALAASPMTAGFVYDGLGRCVKRTLGDEATVFVYDGWKPIGEFDQWGNFQAWNVYGAGADEILLRNKGNMGYTIFLLDRHGNVAFLVDNNGLLREKYTYDVFGQPTIINNETGEKLTSTWYSHDFLFQGREYISQLGIYDYRNRFYLPATGRFLQSDPKGFDAGDMNLFRYCGDDPVDLSDPTGLEWGQPFSGPDEVARDFNRIYNPKSIKDNLEVASTIYKTNRGYSYTEPAWGTSRDSRQRNALPKGEAAVIVGDIHSHGDYSIGYIDRQGKIHIVGRVNRSQANWRSQDTFKSDKPSGSDEKFWHGQGKGKKEYTGYVTTPGNHLWKQDGVNQASHSGEINPAMTNRNQSGAAQVEPKPYEEEQSSMGGEDYNPAFKANRQ